MAALPKNQKKSAPNTNEKNTIPEQKNKKQQKPIILLVDSLSTKIYLQKKGIRTTNKNNDSIFISSNESELQQILSEYVYNDCYIYDLDIKQDTHLRDILNSIRLYKKENNISSLIFVKISTSISEIQLRNLLLLTDVAGIIVHIVDSKSIIDNRWIINLLRYKNNNYGCNVC